MALSIRFSRNVRAKSSLTPVHVSNYEYNLDRPPHLPTSSMPL